MSKPNQSLDFLPELQALREAARVTATPVFPAGDALSWPAPQPRTFPNPTPKPTPVSVPVPVAVPAPEVTAPLDLDLEDDGAFIERIFRSVAASKVPAANVHPEPDGEFMTNPENPFPYDVLTGQGFFVTPVPVLPPEPYLYVGHSGTGMTLAEAGSEEVLVAAAAGSAQPRASLPEVAFDFRADFPFGAARVYVLSLPWLLEGKPPVFERSSEQLGDPIAPRAPETSLTPAEMAVIQAQNAERKAKLMQEMDEYEKQLEEEDAWEAEQRAWEAEQEELARKFYVCGMCDEVTPAGDFCIHCGD